MIRQLLNTLYVQRQGTYLRLQNENALLESQEEEHEDFEVPLHHLGSVVVFGNVLVSPYFIQQCSEDGRPITWFSRGGRFKGRLQSPTSGNVLLRRAQHEALSHEDQTRGLAASFLKGKIGNQRYVLQRALRDDVADPEPLKAGVEKLGSHLDDLESASTLGELRGIEGNASSTYFGLFDDLILSDDDDFVFVERNRRPPEDPVNALLSFAYTLLTRDCEAALEGVGLDPQVGYLHALRPGRPSLALDLVEEFRPIIADRTALTLVNRKQLSADDFDHRTGGAVRMTEEGRSTFLEHWQKRKQREVAHPAFEKKTPIGLLPHVQARLLARRLRGDLDSYPSYEAR